MPKGANKPHASRRFVFIYILLISGPAVVLLLISWRTIQRQWQALNEIDAASNVAKMGPELTRKVERRASELAESCLRELRPERLREIYAKPSRPEDARHVREVLTTLTERHPIARYPFVLRNNSVEFPLVRSLPRISLRTYAGGKSAGTARYLAFMEKARATPRADKARAFYQRAMDQQVSLPAKALALHGVARSLLKLGLTAEAADAYRQLEEEFGDLYDPDHVPYALVAAFALERVQARGGPDLDQLRRLEKQLAEGRWELSAELAQQFLKRFRRWHRDESPEVRQSHFLKHLAMAQVLERALRQPALTDRVVRHSIHMEERNAKATQAGKSYAMAFSTAVDAFQIFYTVTEAGSQRLAWGFSVDLDWVEQQVLPQIGVGEAFVVRFGGDKGRLTSRIVFQNVFPFWELVVTPASLENRRAAARRDALVLTAALVLLCLLGVGVSLLGRDLSRQREINRLRSDFISGISHELKTPLSIVRLYSETLANDPHLDSETRSHCDVINHEAQRLTHLVDQVLNYSRIERGVKQYHLRVGDLGETVRETADICRRYLAHKGFTLSANIADSLPQSKFDPSAISSIVLNLIDNAVKYAGDSRAVRLDLLAEDSRIVLVVEDHGIGIPQEEIEKIFQPFYRVNTGVARGGSGLGLFIVQHIVKAHEGRIEVDSKLGCWTRVRVQFPAFRGQPVSLAKAAGQLLS